ncbi:MAG: hypothetical protein QM651_17860 [Rhodoblastus sp.]
MSNERGATQGSTMQDLRTIEYVNWQHQRGALGEIVFGHLDPIQAVHAICITEKGTVPLEPEKCVRLMPWIDAPEPTAIPNLTRELFDAIKTYEPRVTVDRIVPSWMEDGRWKFLISLHLSADIDKKIVTIEVPYGPS